MNLDQWLTIVLTAMAVLVIPLLAIVIRGAMKWTQLAADVKQIAGDSVRDRETTDRRLRWLEENTWKRK